MRQLADNLFRLLSPLLDRFRSLRDEDTTHGHRDDGTVQKRTINDPQLSIGASGRCESGQQLCVTRVQVVVGEKRSLETALRDEGGFSSSDATRIVAIVTKWARNGNTNSLARAPAQIPKVKHGYK